MNHIVDPPKPSTELWLFSLSSNLVNHPIPTFAKNRGAGKLVNLTVNPIYHHRNLLLKGFLKKPLYSSTNQWEFGTSMICDILACDYDSDLLQNTWLSKKMYLNPTVDHHTLSKNCNIYIFGVNPLRCTTIPIFET